MTSRAIFLCPEKFPIFLKLTLCKQIRNQSGSQQPCRQAPPTLQTERKFPILNFPTSKNRLFETHFIHFKHDLFAFCQIQSRKTHMSQHPLGMNSKTAPDRSPKHAPVPVTVSVPVNQLWNTRHRALQGSGQGLFP